jgi:hypothetical protein
MRVLVETAFCLALALAISLIVIVPLERMAPHRSLPERFESVRLAFVLFLVISPLGAAIVTGVLIFLSVVVALVLVWIGWLINSDLLVEAKAAFFASAPPFVHGIRSWQVLIAIYVITFITLLAQGIRVLIQHDRPSGP